MKQENFEFLKDNIKYMGFGETLYEQLGDKLRSGVSDFQLGIQSKFNGKQFEAILNFRRSDNSDMYFFNSYNAALTRANGEKVDQQFYLNKGKGVTAKEAYNLLEGRAVFKELNTKEGETYKAWIQLDFNAKDKNNNYEVKQYHENYGYDIIAALEKYPIQELKGDDTATALLQSLHKGNVQAVTMDQGSAVSKMFIEANPQYKTVNIYTDSFQRLNQEQRAALKQHRVLDSGKQNAEELSEGKKSSQKKEKTIKPEAGNLNESKKKNRSKGISH